MKTKLIFLVVVSSFIVLLFTQCNKADNSQSTNQIAENALKVSTINLYDQNMADEYAVEGVDNVLNCVYTCLNSVPIEPLSPAELEALLFVREEELLAHDVYKAMYALYPIPVFNNISNSEAIHAYAMKVLLDKYNLPDPAENHQPGVFQNTEIQALYNNLVAFGSQSSNNAMVVGATIEDFDIADLIAHLENDIDNTDLKYAFEQLLKGSRNHYRAFNAHLNFRNIVYQPQYITPAVHQSILSTGWEIGMGFCICQITSASKAKNETLVN